MLQSLFSPKFEFFISVELLIGRLQHTNLFLSILSVCVFIDVLI